jgi:hypothetical protein
MKTFLPEKKAVFQAEIKKIASGKSIKPGETRNF